MAIKGNLRNIIIKPDMFMWLMITVGERCCIFNDKMTVNTGIIGQTPGKRCAATCQNDQNADKHYHDVMKYSLLHEKTEPSGVTCI